MEALSSGTLIGEKYVVTELLGSGGMGHVYHARHRSLEEFEVAVKVLDPEIAASVEHKERFRYEVLAGYRVNHPHVVRMYEYFDIGNLQAYAMEYIEGGTLLEALSEGPIPYPMALSFMKQIALGLAALHEAGTWHRDIKPDNVLLTPDGCVKLSDFGVARIRGMPRSDDDSGLLAGTPKYVPPEYVENGDCDHRGDIYALGVIAYEMFAGQSPFRSTTSNSLMRERLEPHGLDLSTIAPDVPPSIASLVERCLALQPLHRWPHARDLADAIRTLQRAQQLADTVDLTTLETTKIRWKDMLNELEVEAQEARP